jgi:MFS family permease
VRGRSLLALVDLRQFEPNARLFFAFGVPYFSGMGLFTLLYNLYLVRLGYHEDFIGLLASMTPLSSGLAAVPVGVWSDRLGRKPFLMGAAVVLALAQTGLCLTTNRSLLLLFGFLGGFSPAMVFVNHVPYLAENCRPEHRGPLISLGFSIQILTRMMVGLVGGVLPALFGALLGVGASDPAAYRGALMLGAAVTAFSALPVTRIREGRRRAEGVQAFRRSGVQEDRTAEPKSLNTRAPERLNARTPERLNPWPLLLTLAAVSAFRGLSMGMSLPFFNVFFAERFHAPAAAIGTIFFAAQLASLPSAVISSRLPRRFGVIPLLVGLRLVMALALAVMGAAAGVRLAVPLFLLYTACESAGTPVEMAFANDAVARSHWGRAQSLRVMAYQLLSATGSMFAGTLIVRAGYPLTFLLAAVLVLGSVAVLVARFSHLQAADDTPAEMRDAVEIAAE